MKQFEIGFKFGGGVTIYYEIEAINDIEAVRIGISKFVAENNPPFNITKIWVEVLSPEQCRE